MTPPEKGVISHWKSFIREHHLGDGATKEEATNSLFETVAQTFDGTYKPLLIVYRRSLALIWREPPNCWFYVIKPIETFTAQFNVNVYFSRELAERAARLELATAALEQGEYRWPEEVAQIIEDEKDRAEFISTSYRQKAITQLMEEHACDWHHASLIYEDLLALEKSETEQ